MMRRTSLEDLEQTSSERYVVADAVEPPIQRLVLDRTALLGPARASSEVPGRASLFAPESEAELESASFSS